MIVQGLKLSQLVNVFRDETETGRLKKDEDGKYEAFCKNLMTKQLNSSVTVQSHTSTDKVTFERQFSTRFHTGVQNLTQHEANIRQKCHCKSIMAYSM